MDDIRTRFTKWYYRSGYRMIYKPGDGINSVAEMIFVCPLWVRPLIGLFFSPCAYYRENSSVE